MKTTNNYYSKGNHPTTIDAIPVIERTVSGSNQIYVSLVDKHTCKTLRLTDDVNAMRDFANKILAECKRVQD